MKPPKLCRHVNIGPDMGKRGPLPDFYSLRVECEQCRRLHAWLSRAYGVARREAAKGGKR